MRNPQKTQSEFTEMYLVQPSGSRSLMLLPLFKNHRNILF